LRHNSLVNIWLIFISSPILIDREFQKLTYFNSYDWIDRSLATIERANWSRSTQVITSLPGSEVTIDGRSLINFGSNDYLGLAGDDRVIQAAIQATQSFGTGATGSRLMSGHKQLHQDLELAIATLKGTEAALVFSSGYLANLGTIAALVGKKDLILSDRLNHSSLKNGALLSGAKMIEYQHCDMIDLDHQLQAHRANYRRCLIITDTVFSMDGDICPVAEIQALSIEYSSMLLVDEAHATGIFGATGAGIVEAENLVGQPLIEIGTLSKAIGSLGGYVAGTASLIDFLRNRCASWIYTTGLSPADTAAALKSIEIIATTPQLRQQLWQNVEYLKQQLSKQLPQLRLIPSASPIICIELPDAQTAISIGSKLKQAGIFAPAIRPPTVPTSRIRLSLMAIHQQSQLAQLVNAIELEIPATKVAADDAKSAYAD
jgi:8-amino-7-oxononanoate synthase